MYHPLLAFCPRAIEELTRALKDIDVKNETPTEVTDDRLRALSLLMEYSVDHLARKVVHCLDGTDVHILYGVAGDDAILLLLVKNDDKNIIKCRAAVWVY